MGTCATVGAFGAAFEGPALPEVVATGRFGTGLGMDRDGPAMLVETGMETGGGLCDDNMGREATTACGVSSSHPSLAVMT